MTTTRDVFGAPEAREAGERLRLCTAVCGGYAERVFTALHGGQEGQP
ncbi:Chromate resistance protein ChrB [Streptomyces sp. NPDC046332]